MTASELEMRLINFAVNACNIAERLPKSKVGKHVSGQLIRSASSPAANYGEAQSAESRRDFIHKINLCLKELREVLVWLTFIQKRNDLSTDDLAVMIDECNQLISIFVKSAKTAASKERKK